MSHARPRPAFGIRPATMVLPVLALAALVGGCGVTPGSTSTPGAGTKASPAGRAVASPPWKVTSYVIDSRTGAIVSAAASDDRMTVALNYGPAPTLTYTTTDGSTWEKSTIKDGSVASLAAGSGEFVAVGAKEISGNVSDGDALAWRSSDGSHWTPATVDKSAGALMGAVVYARGTFVAVGGIEAADLSMTGVIWHSTDGLAWQATVLPSHSRLSGLTPTTSGFIALDGDGEVWSSGDGVSWVDSGALPEASGEGSPDPFAVASDGTRVIALGRFGETWISDDGTHWTSGKVAAWAELRTTPMAQAVAAYDGGFVVASLGGMWASVDGKTWVGGENDMSEPTSRPSLHSDGLFAVLPFRGSLWAVGEPARSIGDGAIEFVAWRVESPFIK